MKIKLSLLLLFFLITKSIDACSCGAISFCEYYEDYNTVLVFKAKVVGHKNYGIDDYGNDNLAVYLELQKTYIDELGITDTVKLYGSSNEGTCAINVFSRYPLGDTLFTVISGEFETGLPNNPDAANEDHLEYFPILCNWLGLKVKNGIVKGYLNQDLSEYPLTLFEEGIRDCDFPEITYTCPENDFTVFPNPSFDGSMTIRGTLHFDTISQIRVFSPNGQLLFEDFNRIGSTTQPLKISNFENGIHILEIMCNGERYYRKLLFVPPE